jgi:hypothetical protein
VLTVGLFNGQIDGDTVLIALGTLIGVTWFGGLISFFPALVAIVVAEVLGWRSLYYYLAAGGLIGAVAWQATGYWDGLDFADHLLALCLAAGFAGGFVYWLAAGRDAGAGATAPG